VAAVDWSSRRPGPTGQPRTRSRASPHGSAAWSSFRAMDLTRVRPTELVRQPLRGQDFANAFTAAFCLHPRSSMSKRRPFAVRCAKPPRYFLVRPGRPPAFIMGGAGAEMSVGNHPPVPAVINDPHSAWARYAISDAWLQAGGLSHLSSGTAVGKNPELDNAAILDFLRHLFFTEPQPIAFVHHGAAFQLQPDRQNSRLRTGGHCPRGLFSSFQAPPQLDRLRWPCQTPITSHSAPPDASA